MGDVSRLLGDPPLLHYLLRGDFVGLLHYLLRGAVEVGILLAFISCLIVGIVALSHIVRVVKRTRTLTARRRASEVSLILASRTLDKAEKKVDAIREAEQEIERQRRLEIDREIWRKKVLINDVVQDANGGPLLIIIPTPAGATLPAEYPDGVTCAFYRGDRSKWSWYHGHKLVLVPKEQIDSIQ